MSDSEVKIKDESQITLKDINKGQWNALWASFFGFALDVMDLMIFSLVMVDVMAELGMDTSQSGMISSSALVAAAIGGIIFGVVADKIGRIKALSGTIVVYAIATFCCGLSQNWIMLLICRFFIGLGLGGEYGTGAALVTEAWPNKYRSRVMAVVQSGFAVGYALAAILTMVVTPFFGWRAVFFVGILPAFFVFFVRKHTPESEKWEQEQDRLKTEGDKFSTSKALGMMFSREYIKNTIVATLFVTGIQVGYWSLGTWGPAFLALPIEEGGRGFTMVGSAALIILQQAGNFPSYFVFGWLSDRIGIKKTYVIYILGNIVSIWVFLTASSKAMMIAAYPFVGFFFALFAGFGPILTAMYPTSIRATATGFVYNTGRLVAGLMPTVIGVLAASYGLDGALKLSILFWVVSFICLIFLPKIEGNEKE